MTNYKTCVCGSRKIKSFRFGKVLHQICLVCRRDLTKLAVAKARQTRLERSSEYKHHKRLEYLKLQGKTVLWIVGIMGWASLIAKTFIYV